MNWPGYVPWKEPRPGNYTDQFPTHYSFAPAVERVAKSVIGQFPGVSLNTYHKHPPGAPQYERVSMDVWGPRGRGDRLDPAIGQKIFEYLFNLPGEPDIEWAIYRGHMWVRGQGWQPSPPGPVDSDPRHDHHIHISYGLKYDTPKGDDPMTENVLWGVDIHPQFQSGISVPTLKSEGFDYLIAKASQGTWQQLYAAREYVKAARDSGMIGGYYHFLDSDDVWVQLEKFLEVVGNPAGKIICVDFEDPKDYGIQMQGAPSITDLYNFVYALRKELSPEHPIWIYSANWYFQRIGNPDITALMKDKNCIPWASRYTTATGWASGIYETVPARWWNGEDGGGFGGQKPKVLQFTDRATVKAFRSPVDANAFRGTLAEFKEIALGSKAPPIVIPPKPTPEALGRVIIGNKRKPLRIKEGNAIVREQRKLGRIARFSVFPEAKEIEVSEPQNQPVSPGPGVNDVLQVQRALHAPPTPQNQPVEADSHGPSNKGTEETALRPGRKVSAATAAMFLTTIIAYVLNQFYGIELPPEVSAAITGLLGVLVAYFVPEGS